MLAIAHRGYSSGYPENTDLAFEMAIRAGAEFIETDLRLTRDQIIVCSHDKDLSRIAGHDERIADLTLVELKKIDVGAETRIPTLDEVLSLTAGRAGLLLDVKVETAEMAARIVSALATATPHPKLVFGVRHLEQLAALRACDADLPVLALISDYDEIEAFAEKGVRVIRIWEEDLTPARLQAVRDAGCEAWVTAGLRGQGEITGTIDQARLFSLNGLGIDGVLLNDPTLLVNARQHWTPQ